MKQILAVRSSSASGRMYSGHASPLAKILNSTLQSVPGLWTFMVERMCLLERLGGWQKKIVFGEREKFVGLVVSN
jgi:hypothetical protein